MAFRRGVGEDTNNGKLLANLIDFNRDERRSLRHMYEPLTANVALSSQSASRRRRDSCFQQALEGQALAISGVNIDEKRCMIEYQRTYQASAKVIATVSEIRKRCSTCSV